MKDKSLSFRTWGSNQQKTVVFVFSFYELQILYLDKPYYDSHDHHGIDKSVIDIDDDTGNELVVGLVDEREVEDEGDGEGDETEEAQEHPRLGVGHVQPVVHWDTTL